MGRIKRVLTALGLLSAPMRYKAPINAIPDAFVVYYTVASGDVSWYSGKPTKVRGRYTVTYYNRSFDALESGFPDIHSAMLAEGFVPVSDSQKDNYFDETSHYSRSMDYRIKTKQGGI
jgi:hypothetical protein